MRNAEVWGCFGLILFHIPEALEVHRLPLAKQVPEKGNMKKSLIERAILQSMNTLFGMTKFVFFISLPHSAVI
jgi:hypothetical protein